MHDYVIITDSTTDFSTGIIEEIGINVLPLSFNIDNKVYHNYPDERDLSTKEFYKLIRDGKLSTSAQINVSEFTECFEECLKNGKDILCIAFSSGLSGTYNSACIASSELKEKYPDRKIIVIDSLCASLGEGLLVYMAAKKKESGMSIQDLAQWVEDNKLNLCHWFTVDDLFHLKRGGRVSSAAAVFGTMLNIKPVLHVDNEGHLVPVSKVRGRKQSLEALVDRMEKTCIEPQNQVVFISHGDCEEDAKLVANLVKERLNVKDVVINMIGPVIGTHSGPGTIALFFFGTER